MKLRTAFLVLSLVNAAVQHPEEWQLWKTQHGKSYQSQREELDRHLTWLANREYINGHNKNTDEIGFSLRLNQFGDWTDEEFRQTYLIYDARKEEKKTFMSKLDSKTGWKTDLPPFVDWRRAAAVTEVKEQGQCGSSYAFSAVGAIEGAWTLKHDHLVNLSAQNIIDCSDAFGNSGCNGGNMKASFTYVHTNGGLNRDLLYPYRARKSICQFTNTSQVAKINGIVSIDKGNESDLQAALANVGPVSVAIDANSRSFRFYYRGVYHSQICSTSVLNHALLAVGYGTTSQTNYWLLKNSWGVYWGIEGYILLGRSLNNHCGIATDASYPIVE